MSNLAILGGTAVGAINHPKWPIWDQKELDAVQDVVRSGMWGTGGPKQVEFEEAFAAFCNAKHGVMMTNGTHTLKLSLEALGIGPGDEVIVPGSTWQATASSILDVNAVPVLVDACPETWTIDPKKVEEAINSRTKAIIPVHLYGRMADMDAILALANKYNLKVIEDCAHQHGSEWKGKAAGTMGAIGSFSLQCSKIMNTGEGGVCITNDDDLYERLYSLKFCGRKRDSSLDTPTMQSGNFRANEFAAAIGLCQLSRLADQNALREEHIRYLEDAIQQAVPGITYLYRDPRVTKQAQYRMSLRYNKDEWDGLSRKALRQAFAAETEGAVKLPLPYEPLNHSALYRPFSKKTHKLNDEYMAAIDPARFDLPVIEKMYREEYIGFEHYVPLADKSELDKIVDIFVKLYNNRGALKEYEATL